MRLLLKDCFVLCDDMKTSPTNVPCVTLYHIPLSHVNWQKTWEPGDAVLPYMAIMKT